jgi:hypothetical protein
MNLMLDLETIRRRSAAVNVRPSRMARMAGVDPAVLSRGSNRPLETTTIKLTRALLGEEARLRAHLAGLAEGGGEQSQ